MLGSIEALMGAPFTVRLMLIAMKLSPYGVKPDLCFFLPSAACSWGPIRVLRVCGFFMGLPKSKAQIAWGRYWVVCLLGGFLLGGLIVFAFS
ncbi:hypothetical protein GCM10011400_21560 [Paraburkholderia caffeinilytica]|uniref:Uncharacterized protein n=1 Tax=Paraburkholderia caffeinilytica TaxID=1761016 RepID=A0ABQ1M4L3_9BURK|nr:hypothetical protein GCM10011400_21560 [Paraburkholderia caffeinilytica]